MDTLSIPGQVGKLGVRQLLCIRGALTAAERLPRFPRWPRGWPRSGFRIHGRRAATNSLASAGYSKKDQSDAPVPIL